MLLLVFCDLLGDLAYCRGLEGDGTSTGDFARLARTRCQLQRQAKAGGRTQVELGFKIFEVQCKGQNRRIAGAPFSGFSLVTSAASAGLADEASAAAALTPAALSASKGWQRC